MLEDNFKEYEYNTPSWKALRDIQDLKDRKIFVQNPGGGSSTSYRLPGCFQ